MPAHRSSGTTLRLARLLIFALALLFVPGAVSAKPWRGIEPGRSNKGDVLKAFGEPQARKGEGKSGGKLAYRYTGEQKIDEHTALFYFDERGVVREIHVFPPDVLGIDRETIKASYGERYTQKVTDDLQVYWWYPREGLVVFFNSKGRAVSFIFNAPEKPEKKARP